MSVAQQSTEIPNEVINEWFNQFISSIKLDQMMMETDAVTAEKKEFYNNAITGNLPAIFSNMRIESSKFFIQQIINDYFRELQVYKAKPLKLAFDFSDAKILVWAEIDTDDESTEDALILSEAKANEKYSRNGFFISSTIVEKVDNFAVPSHYRQVFPHGRLSGSHQASK